MSPLLTPYVSRTHAAWASAASPGPGYLRPAGTLVFADISGFTPLTERLARLGKVGAEKLTDVLNEVFASLLDEAEAHGGDLLKFGGDALLLLFTGDGHARRGEEAAHAMQAALRPYRRFRTEGGVVSLRMSVGVASGAVDCFLVGERHRELLVGGPVVDEVVALESAAGPGDVFSGSVVYDPAGVDEPPAAMSVAFDAVGCVPLSLRDHLGGGGDGEHRVSVLSFLKVSGLSAVLRDEGGAAAAEALHEVVSVVEDASHRAGVCFLATDLDADGAKILLSAGAPASTTEDADRMLDALVEVVDAGTRLPVRAGVNCGRAFAVDIGSATRRTYAVMGDATNLAARVMGKAAPRTVLATQSVLDTVRSPFALTPLPPFTVKGKSHPVEAAEVRRPVGEAAAARVTQVGGELVGREHELAVLREAITAAVEGSGTAHVVELVGEPGIGKSCLVRAFVAAAEDAALPVVVTEAAPYATASPYFAVRAPLRRLVGAPAGASDDEVVGAVRAALEARLPEAAPLLPLVAIPFGIDLPDTPESAEVAAEFRAARVQALVVDLIDRLLPGPAAFAVEDAHWLDPASADLWGHLLDLAALRPWAVCVARREVPEGLVPDRSSDTVRRVAVGPLPEDAARRLVRTAAGDRALSAAEQAALLERSGGNPLFLLELVKRADDGGDLPDSVEAVIAARIDTLGRQERSVLQAAAVLGGRFDAPLLTALLDGTDVAPRATEVLDGVGDFLALGDDGRYRFRHALLRDVAYERLPFRRRRELHGRAGELVQAAADDVEEWSDLLSLHYTAARRDGEAWRFSRMAGDRARRTSAPVEAAVFYRRAADAAKRVDGLPVGDVASVWEALGDVCELSGRYAEAAAAYREARRLRADDPGAVAELCVKEGWLRERSGRYAEAIRWFTKGETLLAAAAPGPAAQETATRLRLGRGVARVRQGKYAEAVPIVEQAALEAEASGDKRTLAHAYYILDWVLSDQRSTKATQYRARALPIYEELGDLTRQGNVFNNLGVTAFYEGRWDEAVERYERSRDLWSRSGDAVQLGTAANNIGEVRSDQGHLDEAMALFEEALAVWRAASFPVGTALATSNLGRVAVRAGRFEEGEALLVDAREAFRAIGAESFVLEAEARRAERLVLEGRGAEALPILADVRRRVERLGNKAVLFATVDRIEGWAVAQASGPEAGSAVLEKAVPEALAIEADYEAALMYDALARIGEVRGDERAPGWREAADERFARLGVVWTPVPPLGRPRR